MADVILGDKTYSGVTGVQLDMVGGGKAIWNGLTEEQIAQISANTNAISANTESINNLPIEVDTEGYTDIAGMRQVISGEVARSGNTITITQTFQGDYISTTVVTVDDNDYPISVVTDGVECPWIWTGFEEAAAVEE